MFGIRRIPRPSLDGLFLSMLRVALLGLRASADVHALTVCRILEATLLFLALTLRVARTILCSLLFAECRIVPSPLPRLSIDPKLALWMPFSKLGGPRFEF